MIRKLKFALLTLVVCLGATEGIQAQQVEITPSYGYQFGTRLDYRLGYLKVQDGDFFGVTLGYEMSPLTMLEFTYANVGSELRVQDRDFSPREDRLSDLNLDIIQIGASRYFNDGKVQPYAGGSLGMAIFSPKNENRDLIDVNLDNSTRFAFAFKAGVLINLSNSVGLKFQGDLLLPVEWGGIYVGVGTGGVSSGVSLGATTVIGSLSGGLVFRFGS